MNTSRASVEGRCAITTGWPDSGHVTTLGIMVFRGQRIQRGRWVIVVGVVLAMGLLALATRTWTPALFCVEGLVAGFLASRLAVVVEVGNGQVTVRRWLRTRVYSAADIAEVTRASTWSPVQLRLRSGRLIGLPNVPVDQIAAVRDAVFRSTAADVD